MKKSGVVSVWIGKGVNRESFARLLEYRITEDGLGDFEACPFCRAIGIDSYEPEQFGGRFFPKDITRSRLLFHGTDLASRIEERIPEISPSNCYVLLYGYEYDGKQQTLAIDGFRFQFLGCYDSTL